MPNYNTKNITLQSLELSHFKGIKDLKVEFSESTTISGDNATGKTTIFDAFTWLLFGKDSMDRADFGIKTFTESGDTLHGVEHRVTGVLEIEGQEITLERIYKETWQKRRGSTEAEFTGHTTSYSRNAVPMKKGDYDAYIAGIIPEEQFKLLTNPLYFNEVLDKNKRREIILGLEPISDAQVLSSMDPEPTVLLDRLAEGHTPEDIQKMVKASMKKANDEISSLPVRIDELSGQIIEYDFKNLESEKKDLQAQADLLSGRVDDVQQIIQAANKKAESISQKHRRMQEIERKIESEYEDAKANIKRETWLEDAKKVERKKQINHMVNRLEEIDIEIQQHQERIHITGIDWKFVKSAKAPEGQVCETCGQPLPKDMLADAIAAFNVKKSKKLEFIENEGDHLRQLITKLQKEKESVQAEIKELESIAFEVTEEPEIEKAPLPDEWRELKKALDEEEASLDEEPIFSPEGLNEERKKILSDISLIDEKLGQKKRNAEIKARIKELGAKEKELARIYEEQEMLLKQTEDFTRAKVEQISDKVNAHFGHLSFKLFDIQINGGITETCEALIDGVPYGDANNAAKINAGLDVINTLSKTYQTTAPIFIDNAEAVNQLIKTQSQTIRLVVSKEKKLTVKNQ